VNRIVYEFTSAKESKGMIEGRTLVILFRGVPLALLFYSLTKRRFFVTTQYAQTPLLIVPQFNLMQNCVRVLQPTRKGRRNTGGNHMMPESESELLYDRRFPANQFILAPVPLETHGQNFFN
jgi:hypothetical protein